MRKTEKHRYFIRNRFRISFQIREKKNTFVYKKNLLRTFIPNHKDLLVKKKCLLMCFVFSQKI